MSAERARDLGVKFEGATGKLNSITDVPGVEVGHSTIIRGDGKGSVGSGPVRTGVSAILPLGKKRVDSSLFGAISVLNGNGEVTGASWVEESGLVSGPIMLTNTYSVGLVRDSVLKWFTDRGINAESLPVVGEVSDEFLNDIRGQHVKEEHVFNAIENAQSPIVEEGNVGGGTGAVCYEFKGGIGTSSRVVETLGEEYTVGALVQANHGLRRHLTISGKPVGKSLGENLVKKRETGSIVGVIITDAPLMPVQLRRVARRAYHGLARTGSVSSNGSGDFFIAVSTASSFELEPKTLLKTSFIPNSSMDPLFEGTVFSVEEAIINSLVAAEPMKGFEDHYVSALPHESVRKIMQSGN